MLKSVAAVAVALLAAAPALANDSTAEIKTGGLVLTRTDAISMDSEQLFISLDEIQVAYRFRNRTEEDVDTIVAFPMPDIQYNPYGDTALPDLKSDNFLGFSATVEGQPVAVELEQRAFAGTLDVTDTLKEAGVPLFPFGEAAFDALEGASAGDAPGLAEPRHRVHGPLRCRQGHGGSPDPVLGAEIHLLVAHDLSRRPLDHGRASLRAERRRHGGRQLLPGRALRRPDL